VLRTSFFGGQGTRTRLDRIDVARRAGRYVLLSSMKFLQNGLATARVQAQAFMHYQLPGRRYHCRANADDRHRHALG